MIETSLSTWCKSRKMEDSPLESVSSFMLVWESDWVHEKVDGLGRELRTRVCDCR